MVDKLHITFLKLPARTCIAQEISSHILNKNNDTGISFITPNFTRQHNNGETTLLANYIVMLLLA